MKRKQVLGILAAVVLATGSLVGCGNQSGTDKTAETDKAGEKTEIDFWYYTAESQAVKLLEQVESFQEENPDIVVNIQSVPFADIKKQLSIGVAADQLPDIAQCDVCDTASFAGMGVAVDITEELEAWEDFEQFYEGPLSSNVYEGKYYGIPLYSNCLAIMYNKDIFDEKGLEYPDSDWTWDDFKELVYATSDDNHYGLTTCMSKSEEGVFNTMPFIWQAGADYDSMDSEGAVEAMSMLYDFYKDGCMSKELLSLSQFDMCSSLFTTEKSAMMVGGSWLVTNIQKENPDMNYGVVPFPKYKNNDSAFGGSNLLMLKDENRAASLKLMKYLTSRENSLEFSEASGLMSPRVDTLNDERSSWSNNPVLKVYKEQFEFTKARGPHPNWPEISSAIQYAIQDIMTEHQTVEEALNKASAEITEIIDK